MEKVKQKRSTKERIIIGKLKFKIKIALSIDNVLVEQLH